MPKKRPSPEWIVTLLRQNGFIESFNGRLRDEFLNGEIFYSPPVPQPLDHRAPMQ